jgi:hypothetical protein
VHKVNILNQPLLFETSSYFHTWRAATGQVQESIRGGLRSILPSKSLHDLDKQVSFRVVWGDVPCIEAPIEMVILRIADQHLLHSDPSSCERLGSSHTSFANWKEYSCDQASVLEGFALSEKI